MAPKLVVKAAVKAQQTSASCEFHMLVNRNKHLEGETAFWVGLP